MDCRTKFSFREIGEAGLLGLQIVGDVQTDGDAVIASVEVDARLFAQLFVAPSGQLKQAAKGWDRTGRQTGEAEHFVAAGEAETFDAVVAAETLAVEPAVGGQHEHREGVVRFANQRFGPARQRCAAHASCVFAGKDGFVTQHVEGNILLREPGRKVIVDGWMHVRGRRFYCRIVGSVRLVSLSRQIFENS